VIHRRWQVTAVVSAAAFMAALAATAICAALKAPTGRGVGAITIDLDLRARPMVLEDGRT
jgi:hypothetical protein